jgi:SAM-dependent methyltransferase
MKNGLRLLQALGHDEHQARPLSVTFQDFRTDETFDIVVLANSINHLNDAATIHLHTQPAAADEHRAYFRRIFEMLAPGGVLIMTDCDRYNLFASMGKRSPVMPDIEWHKHQSPRTWSALLSEYGFQQIKISWSSPNSLGRAGRLLFGNRLAAFALLSHFRIEARRPRNV